MTKSEAKVLETDVVMFPMKFGQRIQEKTRIENEEDKSENPKEIVESNDSENRFARLRKSPRKKSASIL